MCYSVLSALNALALAWVLRVGALVLALRVGALVPSLVLTPYISLYHITNKVLLSVESKVSNNINNNNNVNLEIYISI